MTKFVKALHTSSLLCPRTIGACLRRAFAVRGPQGGRLVGDTLQMSPQGEALIPSMGLAVHEEQRCHQPDGSTTAQVKLKWVLLPCLGPVEGGSAKFRGLLLWLGQITVRIQGSLRSLRYADIRLKIEMEECKLREIPPPWRQQVSTHLPSFIGTLGLCPVQPSGFSSCFGANVRRWHEA